MCGIFGILTSHPSPAEIERINDLLIHRGPDDAGVYIGQGVGLAARRLSIVDLTDGHQPLKNENGRVWLVCNGEIYNAPELRQELEAAGHRFSTRTDTETIVHAYEQWGDEAVTRLRGMFAFALWDVDRSRLLLVRDRFGMKPLYYAQVNGQFAFASEVRPILVAMPELPRQANLEALWHMFEVGFIPFHLTVFQQVYKLPAAHLMIVEGGRQTIRSYWQLEYPLAGEHVNIDAHSASEEFGACLRETVDAWRMSDVPVGSLLSGGIDSSSMAALLTEINSSPIHTFNIGFEFSSRDESHLAREFAQIIGSQHHEITFSLADFDYLPEIVRRLEEPECSATCLPLYLLYKACHEAGFKVVVTGEGADELLGGYHWYRGDQRVRPFLRIPRQIRALILKTPVFSNDYRQRVFALGTRDPAQRYLLWLEELSSDHRAALLNIDVVTPFIEVCHERLKPHYEGRHPFDQFSFLDSQTRLVDYIVFNMDHLSMAHSVEARPPFLDHELWEFTARLPPELKLSPHGNKYLLRSAMKDLLPAAVVSRPKKGLEAPEAIWWRSERLPGWAEEILHPTALAESGYFNSKEVMRLRDLHRSHRAELSSLLTGILTTQLWHYEVLKSR